MSKAKELKDLTILDWGWYDSNSNLVWVSTDSNMTDGYGGDRVIFTELKLDMSKTNLEPKDLPNTKIGDVINAIW